MMQSILRWDRGHIQICLLALRGRVLRGSPMKILLIFCIISTKRSRLSGVRSYSGRDLHNDATFRPAQMDKKREREGGKRLSALKSAEPDTHIKEKCTHA